MKIRGNRRAQVMLAAVVGVAAFGTVVASAATLGGLNSSKLGADTGVVASCDNDGVAVDYTTAFAGGKYTVTNVKLTGIAAGCAGNQASVSVLNAANAVLSTGAAAVPTGGGALTIPLAAAIDAQALANVAVVIAG